MKKTVFLILLVLCTSFICCRNNKNSETTENNTSDVIQNQKNEEKLEQTTEAKTETIFDINNIAISDADLGEFPFFSIPDGMQNLNRPKKSRFGRLLVPIDGVLTLIEGKVWGSSIVVQRKSGESWSFHYFQKSYDDAIKAVGGIKIFDGRVSKEELKELEKIERSSFFRGGVMDYWNDPIRVYVIRRANDEDVYIQLSGNNSSGKLQILQKTPFKQTIKILKSDQIQKDLNEKGKAILHINFDTDKATLKSTGKEAVAEISKALQADNNLKISINGHTDNTGDETHNIQLSKDRAETVKKSIITSGIDNERLTSYGFGSKNPIADNSNESGRAQNRRVELIKIE